MLRLDFSAADLNLPGNRDKTRRSSVSGVQDKVQLKRVRGGFKVVESGGDYILTPAYDLLNTSVHFPNEPSATGEAKTRYVAKFRDRLRAIAQ